MKKLKKLLKWTALVAVLLFALSFVWTHHVASSVKPFLYQNAQNIDDRHTGVLLGTSKYARGGRINLFYQYRIEAATQLYKSGKIDYVIVSGDNSTMQYNEPEKMQSDLVDSGVPQLCVIKDYAGFRTLDSMVRAKKVFGQEKFTVISQRFHAERAVFIARHFGIDAIGFCAKDVPTNYSFKTKVREHFARIKMFLDLYILHTAPKFLGDPIEIPS